MGGGGVGRRYPAPPCPPPPPRSRSARQARWKGASQAGPDKRSARAGPLEESQPGRQALRSGRPAVSAAPQRADGRADERAARRVACVRHSSRARVSFFVSHLFPPSSLLRRKLLHSLPPPHPKPIFPSLPPPTPSTQQATQPGGAATDERTGAWAGMHTGRTAGTTSPKTPPPSRSRPWAAARHRPARAAAAGSPMSCNGSQTESGVGKMEPVYSFRKRNA